MRTSIAAATILATFFCATTAGWAGEHLLTAKVYRDYPGYINPALCENPNLNLNKSVPTNTETPSAATPVGTSPSKASTAATQKGLSTASYAMQADDPIGLYLTVWGGGVATHDLDVDHDIDVSLDTGYGLGVAAGHDYGPIRVEIEGSWRDSGVDQLKTGNVKTGSSEDLEVAAVMLNGYADFKTDGNITPYLGAGIGYARVELADADDDVLAGQLAAGVQIAVSPAVAIDLGYRFMMTEDADLVGTDVEVRQHTAMLGVQIRF